jgi:hypothetical protein
MNLGAEVLAVDLERVQSAQVAGGELPQLLGAPEHVGTDAGDVEVVGHVEELAQRGLVSLREAPRKRLVDAAQLSPSTMTWAPSRMLTSAPGIRATWPARNTPRSHG